VVKAVGLVIGFSAVLWAVAIAVFNFLLDRP
jgi:hypothetical protein